MRKSIIFFIIALFAINVAGFAQTGSKDKITIPGDATGCEVVGSTNNDSWTRVQTPLMYTIPGHSGCVYICYYEKRGFGQNSEFRIITQGVSALPGSDCPDLGSVEVQNFMLLEIAKQNKVTIDYLGNGGNYVIKLYKGACQANIVFGDPGADDPIELDFKLPISAFEVCPPPIQQILTGLILDQSEGQISIKLEKAKVPCNNAICCQARYNVSYLANDIIKFTFVDSYYDQNIICRNNYLDLQNSICLPSCDERPTNWPTDLNHSITTTPNPSSGNVGISISDSYSGTVTYEVVDINGNVVATGTITLINGRANIDLSALGNGSYKIRLKNQYYGIGTGNIIIQK